jgi:hypothetical protein
MAASHGGQHIVNSFKLLFVRDVASGKEFVMTCFVTKYVTFYEIVEPRIVTRKELGCMVFVQIA